MFHIHNFYFSTTFYTVPPKRIVIRSKEIIPKWNTITDLNSFDCRVSEWSEWSECSKSCGLGQMLRTRKVIAPSKRGGVPCPVLKQTKWCGSARSCNTNANYFKW